MKHPLILITSILLLFSACASNEPIPEEMPPEELFQKAQLAQEQAVSSQGFVRARKLYELFIERHSDQIQKAIEAEYEIAFIYYKQKDWDQAEPLFSALLAKYESEQAGYYPEWPKVLAQKLLGIIEAEKNPAKPEKTQPEVQTEP